VRSFDGSPLSAELKHVSARGFIDIGSCGLHTIHNAFRSGLVASKWELSHFFSSLSWLFKDTPARREDYTRLTGSSDFPLDHCPHRWVENVMVAERALKVWPHVKQFIKSLLAEKKAPNTKSFEFLQNCLNDHFLTARIECFISIAKTLQPFLKKFQSDAPMLPFMAHELFNLLRSLLQRFVAPEVFKKECSSVATLLCLDMSTTKNLLPPSDVDIGFKSKAAVKEIKTKVSQRDIFQFQMESRDFLKAVVTKIIDKTPIKNKIVQNLDWLQPKCIVNDCQACVKQLENVMSCLVSIGRINPDHCDNIKMQFLQWQCSISASYSSIFSSFCCSTDRLDTFFSQYMGHNEDYSLLWSLARTLLMLSHGQATVERGFSVNKEVMLVNMHEKTVVAKRLICDHVASVGGLSNVSISSGLLIAAAGARTKYRLFLEEKAELEKQKSNKQKRDDSQQELDGLKTKKARLEKDISSLTESADKLAEKAENTNSHKFLIESNAMRRAAKSKNEQLAAITLEIQSKVIEIGSL
jgi:hypothetical protein